ncbi:MAG TPA: TrbI/VirB10 family protein [Thermoanaerobaculia bacterium]|nr:TrbI/VirB10 family protein [Thermoanaerobaculia bacterium]
MGERLEMPPPPRPKRLNRLALIAVLALLGVAVAAVFSTLAPPRPAKVAAEGPDGGGLPRPGFLEREPVGAPAGALAGGVGGAPVASRTGAGMGPGAWRDVLTAGGPSAVAGAAGGGEVAARSLDAAARAELEEAAARAERLGAARAGSEPGPASTRGAVPGGERGAATPAPGSRQEAYRRALLAPVTPAGAATMAAAGTAGFGAGTGGGAGAGGAEGAEAVGERIARFLAAAAPTSAGFPAASAPGGPPPDGGVAAAPPAAPPANGQAVPGRDHQGFLRAAEAPAPAALGMRRDRPAAGLVVEAGSVIPAALVTAVDSDVAGPLVAQVTQDVFDRNQRRVAIPRGSRLIGSYDSQVALGERRLLVAWGRVIFPDGSGASFPGLPAAAPSGEAGLPGAVDNHMARVFGSAILLSVLSAGVQLSQPQESASFGTAASARQVAAAAVGQELSSVALEMLRRQLSVPPTLRIAAGTRFYVLLRADLRFEEPAPE